MPLSAHSRDKLLNHLFDGPVFVSVHSSDPGLTGFHEVPKSTRGKAYFAGANNGTRANSKAISVEWIPASRITHLGIWGSATGGKLLWTLELPEPVVTRAGDTLKISPGDITVALT